MPLEPGITAQTSQAQLALLAAYQPQAALAGSLTSVGSDSMARLVGQWAEQFRGHHPKTQFAVLSPGSAGGPKALAAGRAAFAPMSRPMTDQELATFEKQHGYQPLQLPVAIDLVAFYVHQDNPLQSVTLAQLDALFSRTRNRRHPRDLAVWGDLNLNGPWATRKVTLYGRSAASGTQGYVRQWVLGGGDFKEDVNIQPSSLAVARAVAGDSQGIGYAGLGLSVTGVRPLAITPRVGGQPTAPTAENAYGGTYPLTRYLWLIVNAKSGKALTPMQREFLQYVLSRDGQHDVLEAGYLPINPELVGQARARLELAPASDPKTGDKSQRSGSSEPQPQQPRSQKVPQQAESQNPDTRSPEARAGQGPAPRPN